MGGPRDSSPKIPSRVQPRYRAPWKALTFRKRACCDLRRKFKLCRLPLPGQGCNAVREGRASQILEDRWFGGGGDRPPTWELLICICLKAGWEMGSLDAVKPASHYCKVLQALSGCRSVCGDEGQGTGEVEVCFFG